MKRINFGGETHELRPIDADAQASACCELLAFTVVAGKLDSDHERNCKYINSFASLDDAIEAYDAVSDYPWHHIEYKGRVIEVWRKNTRPSSPR